MCSRTMSSDHASTWWSDLRAITLHHFQHHYSPARLLQIFISYGRSQLFQEKREYQYKYHASSLTPLESQYIVTNFTNKLPSHAINFQDLSSFNLLIYLLYLFEKSSSTIDLTKLLGFMYSLLFSIISVFGCMSRQNKLHIFLS